MMKFSTMVRKGGWNWGEMGRESKSEENDNIFKYGEGNTKNMGTIMSWERGKYRQENNLVGNVAKMKTNVKKYGKRDDKTE